MGRPSNKQTCTICRAPPVEYHGRGMCSKCFWFWITKPQRASMKLYYLGEVASAELACYKDVVSGVVEVADVQPVRVRKTRKGRRVSETESLVMDCLVHTEFFPRGGRRLKKCYLVAWLRDRQREDPSVRVSGSKEVLVQQALDIISQPGRRVIKDTRVGRIRPGSRKSAKSGPDSI